MIYVRWFPGDYLRDTIHLSWLEDCAYRRLLDLYYTQGHSLTDNRKILYKQVRANTPEEMAAVESVLAQFFKNRHKKFLNKKAEKILIELQKFHDRQVNAGKARAKQVATAQPRLSLQAAQPPLTTTTTTAIGSSESEHVVAQTDRLGIPLSLFREFRKLRESLHRPILPGSEDHIFAELIQFQAAGESPVEILTRAVRTSSWKLSPNGTPVRKGDSQHEKSRRTKAALKRLVQEADRKVDG